MGPPAGADCQDPGTALPPHATAPASQQPGAQTTWLAPPVDHQALNRSAPRRPPHHRAATEPHAPSPRSAVRARGNAVAEGLTPAVVKGCLEPQFALLPNPERPKSFDCHSRPVSSARESRGCLTHSSPAGGRSDDRKAVHPQRLARCLGLAGPVTGGQSPFTIAAGHRHDHAENGTPSQWGTDESVCTPGSVPGRLAAARVAAIHLGLPLPAGSSGPPAGIGRATRLRRPAAEATRPFDLAPGGVYRAAPVARGAGALLPHRFTLAPAAEAAVAVCSLWHCPAGHPGSALPTTLPFGARTFLGGAEAPTRPPDRLVRRDQGTAVSPPAPLAWLRMCCPAGSCRC